MLNDFYDIDMMQTINNLAEEIKKKNVSRSELYNKYQIAKDNSENLYKSSDNQIENEINKLQHIARENGSQLEKYATFNVKDLGKIIAKFLTDAENRKFYYKQMKVEYKKEEKYDGFTWLNDRERQYYARNSFSHKLLFYNTIAYDDINEDAIYSFKQLKELTCFEYRPYPSDIIEIYKLFVHVLTLTEDRFDKVTLDLHKHHDFKMDNKTNAIELRIKIIEFVDTLINYRIYHKLENITKEDLEKFEQEYVLNYNKKDDNSRKLTK